MFGIVFLLMINIAKIIFDIRSIAPNTVVFPSICKISSGWVNKTLWRFPNITNTSNVYDVIKEDFVYPNNFANGIHNI